jgi:hypothetical protein
MRLVNLRLIYLGLSLFFCISQPAYAAMHMIDSPAKGSVGANFPCNPESRSADSANGRIQALVCLAPGGNTQCLYQLSLQRLDEIEYKKYGIKFVQDAATENAAGLNARRSLKTSIISYGSISQAIKFEMNPRFENGEASISGIYFPSRQGLARISVMCPKNLSEQNKKPKEGFLNSFIVVSN